MTNESNYSTQVCLSEPMSFRVTCRSMGERQLYHHKVHSSTDQDCRRLHPFDSALAISSLQQLLLVVKPYKFQELPSISELCLLSGT